MSEATLKDLLDDLEAKAKVATPGPWSVDNKASTRVVCQNGHTIASCAGSSSIALEHQQANADYIAACSPETVLALITALREAEEAMSMGAFHHNSCPWLNGKECYCAREKVDKWLAKWRKNEQG